MTPRNPAELALALVPEASPVGGSTSPTEPPGREPHEPDAKDVAPKRMTKRCRRCGKAVPTLAALVWRARRVAADVELAAAHVFQVRIEAGDAAVREDLLKRAHTGQQDGAENARSLLADLRRLQSHDRRCRGPTAARHGRTDPHPGGGTTAPGSAGEPVGR